MVGTYVGKMCVSQRRSATNTQYILFNRHQTEFIVIDDSK